MPSNTPPEEEITPSTLNDIISTIQSLCQNFEWFLPSSDLIEILEVKKEFYYKELYSLRNSEFNPTNLTGWSQEDCSYLIRLLEKILQSGNIEEEFIRSGIYFNSKSLSLLRDSFLNRVKDCLSTHKLDRDLLLLLHSATIEYDDAFDSYFIEKIDLERIIGYSVDDFLEKHEIDPDFGSDLYLKKFLQEGLLYKKISLHSITEEYKERYYYELFGKFRREQNSRKLPQEIRKLYIFFKLEEEADERKINLRYKELLKIYHPDINKNGLEKTKEIIENYKKLMEFKSKKGSV